MKILLTLWILWKVLQHLSSKSGEIFTPKGGGNVYNWPAGWQSRKIISSLLIRTPKSQLTSEQPSTTTAKFLEPTEKHTLYPKTKKNPQWDGRRDTITITSNSMPTKCVPQKFSIAVKVLSPISVFPAWGPGNGSQSPQRIWLWKPAVLDCRTSTGLWETETPILKGHTQVPMHTKIQGKSSDFIKD